MPKLRRTFMDFPFHRQVNRQHTSHHFSLLFDNRNNRDNGSITHRRIVFRQSAEATKQTTR
jgi:hypothetical protein